MVEVGGGLRSYVAAGRELLDGYAQDEPCTAARGQPLIPWPNRLRDGVYEFDGERYQLALSEPAKHNAIHGLVRWTNWSVADRDENGAGDGPRAPHSRTVGRSRWACGSSTCSATADSR